MSLLGKLFLWTGAVAPHLLQGLNHLVGLLGPEPRHDAHLWNRVHQPHLWKWNKCFTCSETMEMELVIGDLYSGVLTSGVGAHPLIVSNVYTPHTQKHTDITSNTRAMLKKQEIKEKFHPK